MDNNSVITIQYIYIHLFARLENAALILYERNIQTAINSLLKRLRFKNLKVKTLLIYPGKLAGRISKNWMIILLYKIHHIYHHLLSHVVHLSNRLKNNSFILYKKKYSNSQKFLLKRVRFKELKSKNIIDISRNLLPMFVAEGFHIKENSKSRYDR